MLGAIVPSGQPKPGSYPDYPDRSPQLVERYRKVFGRTIQASSAPQRPSSPRLLAFRPRSIVRRIDLMGPSRSKGRGSLGFRHGALNWCLSSSTVDLGCGQIGNPRVRKNRSSTINNVQGDLTMRQHLVVLDRMRNAYLPRCIRNGDGIGKARKAFCQLAGDEDDLRQSRAVRRLDTEYDPLYKVAP